MGVDSIADFATEAFDVASETLADGFEYLSDGFDQLTESVGSFAGDSDWFTTNYFGDIIDSVPSVSDFNLSSVTTNFPGVSSIINQVPSADSIFNSAVTQVKNSAIQTASSLVTQIPGGSTAIGLINSGVDLSSISVGNIASSVATSAIRTATNTVTSTVSGAVTGVVALGTNAVNTSVSGLVNPQIPGISQLPTSGFSVNGLVNSVVSALTGSTSAVAATLPRTPIATVTVSGATDPTANAVATATANAAAVPPASQIDTSAAPVGYTTVFNEENGTYNVVNDQTGEAVATGLTEQQATLQAQDQTFIDAGEVPAATVNDVTLPVNAAPTAVSGGGLTIAYDEEGNLLPGYSLDEDNNPVFVGGDFVEPSTAAQANADRTAALRDQARQQQTIRDQRQNKAQSGDWRVRLRLAPNSNYLYNDPNCGPVLWPLQNTDGVIFPYTPTIDTVYKANYQQYDLTHSNYRGYFYQNSAVEQINVRATFTAQDTVEANYLLAVIHFFRSVTKMFYGQDAERGSPPPMCYLSGFGDYQFNEHPVVIGQFNYNLPADVNYIRAQTTTSVGTNIQPTARNRQSIAGNPLSYALQRLKTVGMTKGALDIPFAPSGSLGIGNPSYVPTKMEISLTLLPMQSRQQVSKQFSLKGFANGNLLKGGFW